MTCNGAAIEHSTLPSSVYVCDAGGMPFRNGLSDISHPTTLRLHSAGGPALPGATSNPYSARVRKSSNPAVILTCAVNPAPRHTGTVRYLMRSTPSIVPGSYGYATGTFALQFASDKRGGNETNQPTVQNEYSYRT